MEQNKIEKENIDAMEKLFTEREQMDKVDQNRYRYYEDMYGNEYRWTTHKQEDGKFETTFLKYVRTKNWGHLKVLKVKSFRKRKTAKSWCLKHVRKAKAHQKIVLDARAERKQVRLDAKPKYTKSEVAVQEAKGKIQHYNDLQKKCDRKIKTLETRKKTYKKKTKYYQGRVDKLNQPIVTFI